jgi:predicted ATPase/class 3 adenylate cyclase/Tfp pilus assembly protein PilF
VESRTRRTAQKLMADQPTGTVTLLFTDIEGSTKLWEENPRGMEVALTRHDALLWEAIEGHGGFVFKTVGDAFCAVFPSALGALEAALAAQRGLFSEAWGEEIGALRARMALHTGTTHERGGDYFGPPVNRVARLLSAGHGGQVLLSSSTQELVRDHLPPQTHLRDLGERRLKDLSRPERVFQLTAPDLPSEFPPLRTLESRTNNLPLQATPLIGREREVEAACGLLRNSETRLLTLLGPGGTGKTRVGLQVAAELADDFEDGVFFVPISAITDPALVAPSIARVLGLSEGAQPPEELLEGYLRDRQTLLLLDNLEQVIEAAPVVGRLLSSAANLKILATSRIPLGLYGEYEFPVPPLSLPDPDSLPILEHLTEYEAVRLFVERARAVRPDFFLTEENGPAVVEICARLDGLPLAIELAAARIKLLPPQVLLDRLGNRLKLLTGGARNLPERQRTLRNAIEWSYELLDEGEKLLFGRLGVFSGGATLKAIDAVCDARGDLPTDAFDGVSSLLDKSLLRQEEGAAGEPRFAMLETIHEFASVMLEESGEVEAVRCAHAEYFLALAEEAEPKLWGAEDAAWLDRLEREHDNMRVALSWAIEHEEATLALRLGAALRWFWYMEGYYGEGRRWLEAALGKDWGAAAAEARARALEGVGWLAWGQGDLDRAQAAAKEGLKLSAEAGLGDVVAADLLNVLGEGVARQRGDYEWAEELLTESLALYRKAGDIRGVAWSLCNLANVSSDRGNYEQAKRLYEEGLALSRELAGAELLGAHLINLGYESLLEGEPERATALNEEAAELYRKRRRRGDLQNVLVNLGWAALLQGDHERADASYEECLVLCRELGDKLTASESLEGLACSAGARRDASRASVLFGAAEALREATGYRLAPRDRSLREPYMAAVRAQVDEATWSAARERGRSMELEDAIVYALEEPNG